MNTNTTLSKGSWIHLNQRQSARAGILLLLLLLLTLPTVVQAQFNYTDNGDGTATITGYTGPGGDVTIPDTIASLLVTSIGDLAFGGCPSLTSVTIPASVTSIGNRAFTDCSSLTAITVNPQNPQYSSVAGVLFNNNQTTLMTYPGGKAGAYTIPNSVTSIGDWAFIDCASLTSVTIPDSVTSIGTAAFGGCWRLTSVTIPNSVTNIGMSAFCRCGLTSVTIPGSVTYTGPDTFALCTNLTDVTIGNGVTSTGGEEFWYCNRLTNVTIPSSLTIIRGDTFHGCGLTSITIPDSVTIIAIGAFQSCASLTNVTIPDSVTNIGAFAFASCTSLTSVTIGNGVTSIEQDAFEYCSSLINMTIGNGVTSIGYNAFDSCSRLAVVYFQGNAPSADSSVFAGDNHATVYYLPGTTGWHTTFGGRPTALWTPANPPTIQASPQTQTAEATSAVDLRVKANGSSPLWCVWYLNSTNLLSCSTNCELNLTNVQFSQSGAYTVVVTNAAGAITSAPAMLNVIPAVGRRPVPGVKVTGQTASLCNVDYANWLSPAPNWTSLGSVSLTGTPQYCFDLVLPLPPQRFYRAWQTGTPGVRPSLDLHLVPAITLTGNIGDSVPVEAINQFGPTDAWFTLDTVTLTNTSQLYFDVSAPGQPPRLYRLPQVDPSQIVYAAAGTVYTQSFDSLPDPGSTSVNSGNPVTINGVTYFLTNPFGLAFPVGSSGVGGGLGLANTMTGWYGLADPTASVGARFGATDGDQTTGGLISFGLPNNANRALGLLATSTTGYTAFGAKFVNGTGQTLSFINVQCTGEVWRQSDLAKILECYYFIDPSATNAFSTNATAFLPALNVSFPTVQADVGGVAVDGTSALNQTNLAVVNQVITNWVPGAALWLVWEMADATGKAQALAIDNLSFSASASPTGR